MSTSRRKAFLQLLPRVKRANAGPLVDVLHISDCDFVFVQDKFSVFLYFVFYTVKKNDYEEEEVQCQISTGKPLKKRSFYCFVHEKKI